MKCCILIQITLKYVPISLTSNTPVLVQIMFGIEQAVSHYLNQCWFYLLTNICAIWSWWVIRHSPDTQAHGTNIGPIWGRQDPGGPHVVPMDFAIWVSMQQTLVVDIYLYNIDTLHAAGFFSCCKSVGSWNLSSWRPGTCLSCIQDPWWPSWLMYTYITSLIWVKCIFQNTIKHICHIWCCS